MTFLFIPDKTNGYLIHFAITQNEIFKGKLYDEMFFAEIIPGNLTIITKKPLKETFKPDDNGNDFKVIWNDDYYNPLYFKALEKAQNYIINNWSKHKWHNNGDVHDLR